MMRADWILFLSYAGISVAAYVSPWLVGLTHPNPLSVVVGVLWCTGWPTLLMKIRLHRRYHEEL